MTLPNGNFVVTDSPTYGSGAVSLDDGATLQLISRLTGRTTGDNVGSGGVTVLPNGNYLVLSPGWDNVGAIDAGAVTWGSGTSDITGTVSAVNSIVGNKRSDRIGSGGMTVLPNGNYVVASPNWNGTSVNGYTVGAVTWGSGTSGITGTISAANSLVGNSSSDMVGSGGITVLSNGNYVVISPFCDNGAVNGAGAVTWANGAAGITGVVGPSNSLVGWNYDDNMSRGG